MTRRVFGLMVLIAGWACGVSPQSTLSHGQVIVVAPNSGSDLAAPINSALNSCSPSNGCKIEISPLGSPATLSSPILITKNNVVLVCDSPVPIATSYAHTALAPGGYYYGPIDITGNNIEVSGCALDVSSLGTSGLVAVHVWGSNQVKVHNVVITSTVRPRFPAMLGIRAEGTASRPSSAVSIYDNYVTVPSIAYSVGDNSQFVIFHDNYSVHSYQCFDFNGSGGGAVADAFGITFHDNDCIGDTGPSYVESARDVNIQANTFWQDSTTGGPTIRVHNTLTKNPSLHVGIDGNAFVGNESTTTAVSFFQNVQDWRFTNNSVRNYGTDGITVDSTAGTPLSGIIANNQFLDNGQHGAAGNYCGIRFHQSSNNNVGFVSITGNGFFDDQSTHTELYPVCSDGGRVPFSVLYSGNLNSLKNPPSFPRGCDNCNASGNLGGNGFQ